MTQQIKTYDFYRVTDSTQLAGIPILGLFGPRRDRWYIDLPEWSGPRANLEMVAGADTMLDVFAQDHERINVTFTNYNAPEITPDLMLTHVGDGTYTVAQLNEKYSNAPAKMWLCGVTKFVFNSDYPETISVRCNSSIV
ncbi:MAG: DUF6717 family protein [Bacteroidota bacterium]